MFADRFSEEQLAGMLAPREQFHPFPVIGDRPAWAAVPETLRRELIGNGEQYLGYAWPALPATLYLDFVRTGNRTRFEAQYFARRNALGSLVVAECLDGQGRFFDDILDGIWRLCEESSWVLPAHNYHHPYRKFDGLPDSEYANIDLFAAETGALLSMVHYLLHDRLCANLPVLCARLQQEVAARIIDPFLEHTDYWWMGFSHDGWVNNWAPWCASNCLAAVLLLEDDPGRRARAVYKATQIIDRFLGGYHADGGCDEGPMYWGQAGGALFDCLEWLYLASNSAIDMYAEPLICEIGRYLYRVHIGGDWYINFADCGAKVDIPANLVFRYGQRINDPQLSSLGASAFRAHGNQLRLPGWYPMLRVLSAIFSYEQIATADRAEPLPRDVWMPGTQVMAAREAEGTSHGLFLAAKGGYNNESHNHNDIGQFIVSLDGRPMLIDVGVESYTQKTFSPQRYEIWTMQSAYHNLPTINGQQQQPGDEFHANDVSYTMDDARAEFSLEIAGTYSPEAGVQSWRRTCRLMRGEQPCVEIVDAFQLASATTDIEMSLMTPWEPNLTEAGVIRLSSGDGVGVRVTHQEGLTATVERIAIADERLLPVWGDHLFHIRLHASAPVAQATWQMRIVPDRS